MKLRRRIFDPQDRARLGEHQERAARDALRPRSGLVMVALGAIGFAPSYKCGPEVKSGPQTHSTPRRST